MHAAYILLYPALSSQVAMLHTHATPIANGEEGKIKGDVPDREHGLYMCDNLRAGGHMYEQYRGTDDQGCVHVEFRTSHE